jgi:hypothetical protein
MSVDEEARRQLAHLLRQLLSGELRTKDYDDLAWEVHSDPAVAAIRSRLWFFYSDWMNVRLRIDRLSPERRAMIDRSLAFLSTRLPYRYSRKRFITLIGYLRWVPAIRRRLEAEATEGDPLLWPFFERREWEEVTKVI